MFTLLATGHPAIPTGDFDFTPLLYAALLVPVVGWSRILRKLWMLPVIVVTGGVIDTVADGLGVSTATTASLLFLLVVIVVARRRTRDVGLPPSAV